MDTTTIQKSVDAMSQVVRLFLTIPCLLALPRLLPTHQIDNTNLTTSSSLAIRSLHRGEVIIISLTDVEAQ